MGFLVWLLLASSSQFSDSSAFMWVKGSLRAGRPVGWFPALIVVSSVTLTSPRTHLEGLCKGTNYFGYKLLAENAFKV